MRGRIRALLCDIFAGLCLFAILVGAMIALPFILG